MSWLFLWIEQQGLRNGRKKFVRRLCECPAYVVTTWMKLSEFKVIQIDILKLFLTFEIKVFE